MADKKKLTLDNSTVAGNPGEITVKPLVWARYNPVPVLLLFVPLVIFLVLVYEVSLWFLIPFFIFLAINQYYWISVKERFGADSNGGIIVSLKPVLAAVSTDLANNGFNHFPVIKTIPYKVRKKVQIGDRIATVAVYQGSFDKPYWDDFFPVPAEYATNDPQELEAAMVSYPAEQWDAIARGVAEISPPYKPGLYPVEKENSDWHVPPHRFRFNELRKKMAGK